ncbi:MAG: hypothetical protein Q8P89_01700 [bacterium]|nr:hypothetical protein [bacterium]
MDDGSRTPEPKFSPENFGEAVPRPNFCDVKSRGDHVALRDGKNLSRGRFPHPPPIKISQVDRGSLAAASPPLGWDLKGLFWRKGKGLESGGQKKFFHQFFFNHKI